MGERSPYKAEVAGSSPAPPTTEISETSEFSRAVRVTTRRMRGAQALIKRHGLMVKSRANPAVMIERDSRLAMLRALRQLNLDLEPLRDGPGRPPGS